LAQPAERFAATPASPEHKSSIDEAIAVISDGFIDAAQQDSVQPDWQQRVRIKA